MKPRLAVFEMHHLGDAVIALPFLRAAAKTFETTVICRPGTARLLREAVPGLSVIAWKNWFAGFSAPHMPGSERESLRSGILSERRALESVTGFPACGSAQTQAGKPVTHSEELRYRKGSGGEDAAVCVWPDSRAHFAMWRTGAGRRIGFRVAAGNFYGAARPWRKRRLIAGQFMEKAFPSPLLTHALDREEPETHGESWARMADVLGFEPDYSFPWLPLPPTPSGFESFLAESRAGGRKILALHPGGRLPGKRWPAGKFQKLLNGYLAENGIAVALIRPPGEQCPEPCTPWQRVFETDSVPALGALFAKADGVLCNDSLASHLAAAAGVPVATIFGSGDPAWFAPHGNAGLVIATDACPCRPCVDRCAMPSLVCLESVSIHLVEQKLSAMFADPLQNSTKQTFP